MLAALATAAAAGCAGHANVVPVHSASSGTAVGQALGGAAARAKIRHIVIVIQENRSFDNLFEGFPGADTVSSGMNSKGLTIPLVPVSLNAKYELEHYVNDFLVACDGGPERPDLQDGWL